MEGVTMNSAQQGSARVISSGDRLTIETINDFIQSIRKALAEATTVAIAFEPHVEMDITALQVLCSACKTAAAEGKKFIYSGPLPKALLDLTAASGAERHEYCINNNTSCFRQFGGMQ